MRDEEVELSTEKRDKTVGVGFKGRNAHAGGMSAGLKSHHAHHRFNELRHLDKLPSQSASEVSSLRPRAV